jgi:hypothetical protein
LLKLYQILLGTYQKWLEGLSPRTGCGLVKKEEDAVYAAVESCSNFAIEWESIFQQERFAFDETKISKRRSDAPGTVIISAGGNCIDIKK